MASSHPQPMSTMHSPMTATPPTRPTRPRLSRGISSRKPAPPPVPPSLRDHPLLDVVAHANNSSSGLGASSSSGASSMTSPGSVASSRRSSVSSTSPVGRPTDKICPIPLPSPTNLWSLPAHPSPPIGGPWNPTSMAEPIKDSMDLFDTVPAGSSISAATPNGYPWHLAPGTATCTTGQAREFVSKQPNLHLPRRQALTPQSHPHEGVRSPGSVNPQRHNVGALHAHAPRPSPPVTPAAA